MKTTKILIVDDHEVVRDGLKNMTSLDSISIAGEAGNGEDAVKMYASLKPGPGYYGYCCAGNEWYRSYPRDQGKRS